VRKREILAAAASKIKDFGAAGQQSGLAQSSQGAKNSF
jgi:hypothetical protein